MTTAFIFPGQGSQFVGMGKALAEAEPAARAVFDEVDDTLGEKLSKLIFDGSEDDLRLTRNAQPALMAVSLALLRVLEGRGVTLAQVASHVAGHSLGEYSALAASGALNLADTARLLRRRGEAMQRAVPVGEGAMAAIIGLEFDTVREVAAEAATDGHVCTPANDNAPGQVVVSGHTAAVERAIELAKEKGAKRGLLLPVSAPFHCSLMQPAAEEMAEALAAVTINAPLVPLIANVTAQPVSDPEVIRDLLVRQVTGAVRWRESIAGMAGLGVDRLVEVGAGKVLCGLARRIDRSLEAVSLQGAEEIDAFCGSL
jgi:[acyl-carrier-protein] S-malonyltransferase